MKKSIKLPTLLGLLVLVLGLVAGIFLINSTQIFKSSANIAANPKNVRFSNVTDNSLTVTWTTDIESEGFVKWGATSSSLSKVSLEEKAGKSFVHSVNLIGLEADSDIFVKINSDGTDYDNSGIVWQTKTDSFKVNSTGNSLASGTIIEADGATPAKALVYLTVSGKLLSNITSDEGSYIIPISSYIENITDTTILEISVNNGNNLTSQAVIYPKAAKSIPTIILGKTYDFRTLATNEDDNLPESSVSIPESIQASSRFEVTRSGNNTQSESATIQSIEDGEIITTTDPEFFGTAPKNSEIEIAVESELQTDILTSNSNGKWNWSPPNNLEPGEHKVTIKWKDLNGVLRTLTRTFVVQAAEGPAFESTPSAVPTQQATVKPVATQTPTIEPEVIVTPTATLEPTPETGSLTPTIGLFIMGMGVLLSSLFVWNKSNA